MLISSIQACQHVYVDFGSNIGVQIRKLFEPEKYEHAPILAYFDNVFGPVERRRREVCAFGVEANPVHTEQLRKIEQAYNRRWWRTRFLTGTVVGIRDGVVDFFSDGDTANELWGSSVFDHTHGGRNVTDRELNATRFLLALPRGSAESKVVVKFDIEGSEFLVLPALLDANVLCRDVVTAILIEWHERLLPSTLVVDADTFHNHRFERALALQSCAHGPSLIIDVDDESFLHDGQQLSERSRRDRK